MWSVTSDMCSTSVRGLRVTLSRRFAGRTAARWRVVLVYDFTRHTSGPNIWRNRLDVAASIE